MASVRLSQYSNATFYDIPTSEILYICQKVKPGQPLSTGYDCRYDGNYTYTLGPNMSILKWDRTDRQTDDDTQLHNDPFMYLLH